jgi:hypothetical protein
MNNLLLKNNPNAQWLAYIMNNEWIRENGEPYGHHTYYKVLRVLRGLNRFN